MKELLDVVTRVYDIVFAQILRPPGPEKGTRVVLNVFNLLQWCFDRSPSCPITSFWGECKSSNGSPKPGVHRDLLTFCRGRQ